MNRKGFTLIELLAVILVLGIILVIAAPSFLNAYKDSKLKSEEIFTTRLSQNIDSYIKLNSSDIIFTSNGTANKTEEGSSYQVDVYKGKIIENDIERFIVVNDIITDNIISQEDYINPGNKDVSCSTSAEIEVYRDSDYVYCHKVEISSLNCITDDYIKSICPEEDETCYVIDTCIWEVTS